MNYIKFEKGNPKTNIVALHGFGADENQLVFLKEYLDINDVCYYFIQAPIKIVNNSYCYFPDDEKSLNDIYKGLYFSSVEDLSDKSFYESLKKLDDFMQSISDKPTILSGFSQGGMMSWAYSFLYKNTSLKLSLLYSTSLFDKKNFQKLSKKTNIKVLQIHGQSDDVLSFDKGENLCNFLKEKDFEVEFFKIDCRHEINQECLDITNTFLKKEI